MTMLGLTRKLTPDQEAARQLAIASAVEQKRADSVARERELAQANRWRRHQLWAEAERDRDEQRMREAARVQAARVEREQLQREQAAALDRQRIEALRSAEREVKALDDAIRQLSGPHDLASVAGAVEAASAQAQVIALRELRERAFGRLLVAERACGRHRAGA